MRLVDLDPKWIVSDGRRVGVNFVCPCCVGRAPEDRDHVAVCFEQPIDPGPRAEVKLHWARSGETFETLTLTPSVDFKHADPTGVMRGWHGFVRNGEIT